MITKFSVLYVGLIELENVGLLGTPANDRRYSNERLVEAFHTAKDVAQHMDELGYYCLWTAEHHFQHEGYEVFPNLILLGTWLATQTKRLKLGCAFNVFRRSDIVLAYEPRDAWSVQNLVAEYGEEPIARFQQAYPRLRSERYQLTSLDLDRAARSEPGAGARVERP